MTPDFDDEFDGDDLFIMDADGSDYEPPRNQQPGLLIIPWKPAFPVCGVDNPMMTMPYIADDPRCAVIFEEFDYEGEDNAQTI